MTFFDVEASQRIRYLHFKIKHLEEALEKEDEEFSLDDLNLVKEYTIILNVNYKDENQKKILQELDITSQFHEENTDIEIKDLTFECSRALWVLAKAYAQLSDRFEEEEDWENAVISMVESSKMYKTAAYFSAAAVNQFEKGNTLSPEELELNSEEARIFAQSVAATREESKNNKYFASKLYSGLSVMSKRLFYLKKHEEKKEIGKSTKEKQKEMPETQKESEQDVPDELKERYRNETGRRPYYNEKKTKGFEEWLKNDA